MGLDMYLEKRTYVKNWDFTPPEKRTIVTVTRDGKPLPDINPQKITYLIEEAGYWRKANAIHQWFVEHVQDGKDDCGYYYVSNEHLQELLKSVNTILEDSLQAPSVLPTQSGFFFGSTDYDQYYIEDLKLTKDILEAALKSTSGEYYYHSSW